MVVSAVPVRTQLEGIEFFKVLDDGQWNIREPSGQGGEYNYYLGTLIDQGWKLTYTWTVIPGRLVGLHFERTVPVVSLPLPSVPKGPEIKDVYQLKCGESWIIHERGGVPYSNDFYMTYMTRQGWLLKNVEVVFPDSLHLLHFERSGPVG